MPGAGVVQALEQGREDGRLELINGDDEQAVAETINKRSCCFAMLLLPCCCSCSGYQLLPSVCL